MDPLPDPGSSKASERASSQILIPTAAIPMEISEAVQPAPVPDKHLSRPPAAGLSSPRHPSVYPQKSTPPPRVAPDDADKAAGGMHVIV